MGLHKNRKRRKQRRGGGDVSLMDSQPAIVQRLSQEAQDVSVENLKSRSNLDHESSTSDLALENGGPDLHFQPKAPVDSAEHKSDPKSDVTSPSEARSTSES